MAVLPKVSAIGFDDLNHSQTPESGGKVNIPESCLLTPTFQRDTQNK